MTRRQAINRPLPVSNGIRMRDFKHLAATEIHQGRNGADLRFQLEGDVPNRGWPRWVIVVTLIVLTAAIGWLFPMTLVEFIG